MPPARSWPHPPPDCRKPGAAPVTGTTGSPGSGTRRSCSARSTAWARLGSDRVLGLRPRRGHGGDLTASPKLRSCTASPVVATLPSTISITWPGIAGRARFGSATAPGISSSTTCGEGSSTPSTSSSTPRRPDRRPGVEGLATFVGAALQHWREPDQGIWKVRGDRKHFTRVQGDVLGRSLARRRPGRGTRRRRAREALAGGADEIKADVLDQDVSKRGVFASTTRPSDLDDSLLLLPIMGFLPSDDKRIKGDRAGHRRRADRGRPGPALQGRGNRHRVRGQGGDLHYLLLLAGECAGAYR